MTEPPILIQEVGTSVDPTRLAAMLDAGLASAPRHVAEPVLHMNSALGLWGAHKGLFGTETVLLDALCSSQVGANVETLVHLECSADLVPPGMAESADKSLAFSMDRRELERMVPRGSGVCQLFCGEIRDVYRFLKLNPEPRKLLLWSGSPLNRLNGQGAPYFLRYFSQVLAPEDRLMLSGWVGNGLGVALERSDFTRTPELLLGEFFPGLSGGQTQVAERQDGLALQWESPASWTGARGEVLERGAVDLARWYRLSVARAEEAFAFAGLMIDGMERNGDQVVWSLRRSP